MNQLETNLTLWAICSILLLEILFIICLCRCCFNRIKPKRFYVKSEEYEYLHDDSRLLSKFQSTILRPPHADELALVGTIREPNPTINLDNGVQNFGFYRDDDNEFASPVSSLLPVPVSSSHNMKWIELKPSTTSGIINTAQLSPADYEIRSYPTDSYLYTHSSPPSRPTIIDFRQYRDEYDDDRLKCNDDDDLENFQFHPLHRTEVIFPNVQRTDTSTESYGDNHLAVVPKSILKGSVSTTTTPLDLLSTPYSQTYHSQTPSKFDESPRMSVTINIDEMMPTDCPASAAKKTTANESATSASVPTPLLSSLNRMHFASVSLLNEVEWEVPREFETVVCKLSQEKQSYCSLLTHSLDENLNNNNSNDSEIVSNRQRSQSAAVSQRLHVSRISAPWDREKRVAQLLYSSNDIEQGDTTQQKAFEY